MAIVQDPQAAESPFMPQAALKAVPGAKVLDLEGIASFLQKLVRRKHYDTGTLG